MAFSTQQAAFVEKYLGTDLPDSVGIASGGEFAKHWGRARESWEKASSNVDGQIGKLVSALKSSDDPDLRKIAEFGLNALTGNHKVRIMAAIQDITSAGANVDAKVLRSAAEALRDFDNHLANDMRIKVVDDNPFGIRMSIAATLRTALGDLNRALQAAT